MIYSDGIRMYILKDRSYYTLNKVVYKQVEQKEMMKNIGKNLTIIKI